MDRFTTHNGKIVGFKGDMDKLAEALLRLSEYENTGLLPKEVAEVQKKVESQECDIDYLLNRFTALLERRNNIEMIRLQGENVMLKAEVEKYKEKVTTLRQRFEDAMDVVKQYGYEILTLCKTRCSLKYAPKADSELDPASDPKANPAPKQKQKVAWEAN